METETRAEQSTFSGIRKIIHIDMDAFYASVEQRDNPETAWEAGCGRRIARTASSRRQAMKPDSSGFIPRYRLSPPSENAIVKQRFDAYRAISLQIREIFAAYTPIIDSRTALYRGAGRSV